LNSKGQFDEAIAAYREALRLKPDDYLICRALGVALHSQGKFDEAVAAYREILRLRPDDYKTYTNLGHTLERQGKLDEAIAALRAALRIKPDFYAAHVNLGIALKKKWTDGNGDCHVPRGIASQARLILGFALRQQGRFIDALAEFKSGHELGSKIPGWQHPSAEWVRNAERLVELDCKLPAILRGQDKPAGAAELLAFAQMCYYKKIYDVSARLWSEAFQAQPKLVDDMNVQNRYDAACAAALAGSGQGKDDPPLDDVARGKWRKQALDWLKADLVALSNISEGDSPQARQTVSGRLRHWKSDTDLAGLRNAAALAKLPEDEQKACRAFWADVNTLLARPQGSSPKSGN
jgi:eukaryotic-like serine/threonine-protein kinase